MESWLRIRLRRQLSLRPLLDAFRSSPWPERAALLLAGAILLMLGLTAIAPVTDADSVGYHLAVPLEWLRNDAITQLPAPLTPRLVGLGEMMNAVGLACGTDALGACVQFLGLLTAIQVLWQLAKTATARALAALLCAALPVLLALVAAEKPALFPAVGVFVAAVLVVEGRLASARHALVVATCLASAVASKHSFLLAAGVVGLAALWQSIRARRAIPFLLAVVLVAGIVLGPLFARRYAYFGDPLSPLLERFRPHPDPLVVQMASYLRSYGTDPSVGMLRLVLNAFVPANPREFQFCLGIGALAAFAGLGKRTAPFRWYAVLAGATAVATFLLSQVSGRYLVESYLLGAAALLSAPSPWHRWILVPLGGQAVLVLAGATVGAVVLAPGALTPALREKVLMERASEYEEARWANAFIEPDDVVLYELRGDAFLASHLVPFDVGEVGSGEMRAAALVDVARSNGATLYITYHENREGDALYRCVTGLVAESPNFIPATRNPFGTRPAPYRAYIHRLDVRAPACAGPPAGARSLP